MDKLTLVLLTMLKGAFLGTTNQKIKVERVKRLGDVFLIAVQIPLCLFFYVHFRNKSIGKYLSAGKQVNCKTCGLV